MISDGRRASFSWVIVLLVWSIDPTPSSLFTLRQLTVKTTATLLATCKVIQYLHWTSRVLGFICCFLWPSRMPHASISLIRWPQYSITVAKIYKCPRLARLWFRFMSRPNNDSVRERSGLGFGNLVILVHVRKQPWTIFIDPSSLLTFFPLHTWLYENITLSPPLLPVGQKSQTGENNLLNVNNLLSGFLVDCHHLNPNRYLFLNPKPNKVVFFA